MRCEGSNDTKTEGGVKEMGNVLICSRGTHVHHLDYSHSGDV
jgi:hypothetical protein